MDNSTIRSRFQLRYFILSLLLIAGAIFIGFNVWGSITVGLVLWLIAIISYSGLEFSNGGGYMRNYYGLFGYKIGAWEKLPPITGVTIKQFSKIDDDNSEYSAGIWGATSQRQQELIVMLSAQNSPNGIIVARFPISNTEEAIKFAQDTAEHFSVPVNNYLPTSLFKPL
jgi:hypothetical protein